MEWVSSHMFWGLCDLNFLLYQRREHPGYLLAGSDVGQRRRGITWLESCQQTSKVSLIHCNAHIGGMYQMNVVNILYMSYNPPPDRTWIVGGRYLEEWIFISVQLYNIQFTGLSRAFGMSKRKSPGLWNKYPRNSWPFVHCISFKTKSNILYVWKKIFWKTQS